MIFSPNAIEEMMQRQFEKLCRLDATAAPTVQALYLFQAKDVYEIHFYKHGAGEGLWFRLYDCRVFDAAGQPSETDRSWYDTKAH